VRQPLVSVRDESFQARIGGSITECFLAREEGSLYVAALQTCLRQSVVRFLEVLLQTLHLQPGRPARIPGSQRFLPIFVPRRQDAPVVVGQLPLHRASGPFQRLLQGCYGALLVAVVQRRDSLPRQGRAIGDGVWAASERTDLLEHRPLLVFERVPNRSLSRVFPLLEQGERQWIGCASAMVAGALTHGVVVADCVVEAALVVGSKPEMIDRSSVVRLQINRLFQIVQTGLERSRFI